MRQPCNQVDVDVAEASLPHARDFFENGSAFVQAPNRLRFLVNERLHTQADSIDSAL